MSTNVDKETGSQDRIENLTDDEAVRRVVAELKPLMVSTGKGYVLARYALGSKVNELDKAYGTRAVDKLAAALGRGYGPDNLRVFARIARTWTQAEFEPLAERGLEISDFRELWKLAKVSDEATRARVVQQAIENAWPIATLKEEVRKATGQAPDRPKKAAHVQRELPVLTVTDALNALIITKQARLDEQASVREKLDQIDPQSAQALAAEINHAIDAVRAQRAALDQTEQLLVAALQLPTGAAA